MPDQQNKILKKEWVLAVGILIISLILNYLSSQVIRIYFPERQPASDLLFKLTPYIGWTQYLTDLANIFSLIVLAIYIFKGRTYQIPLIITTFALMEIFRSILTVATPVGDVFGNNIYYGLTQIRQYGNFPSGHFASSFLCYYFIDRGQAAILSRLALIGIWVEGISLILSRGHYSIDLFGGFCIAYFALHITKKYL